MLTIGVLAARGAGRNGTQLSHSSGSKSKRHQTRWLSATRSDFDFDFEKFASTPLNLVALAGGGATRLDQAAQAAETFL
jgi:hypothetical protein